ncbi:MAG: beta-1,4-mannosyl-glycoprotein beta-1,4-N-acetylglucosaminyltransferase [Paracoccaceae bacterium]|jgi:beta-1,4-mannosyl-glycoprotein beta-1,4-N-acetylglucosaminyltransferase|tara:strand:+ start:3755 stop:4600 length:846 start_codon:yes stop_codon:yes gene_type:complete
MRVFDCFPLFNEIDLLELRLNELWDVVDIFVIAEAKTTFTGNSKPMCLPDNAERLAKYMHKIRYVVVEDFPEGISNWGREEYQRNEMKKELSDVLPDDILVFSDVDEIPRAKVIQSIAERGIQPKEVYCLSLDWYSFYLNIKISEKWERIGPRIIRAGDLSEFQSLRRVMGPTRGWARDMMRQIKSSWRMGHWVKRIRVPDAGWHFTWMGGTEAVALKGSSLPVHSNLPEGEKSLAWADARISTLLEDGSRYAVVEVDDSFPSFVRDNLDIFEKHILRKAP